MHVLTKIVVSTSYAVEVLHIVILMYCTAYKFHRVGQYLASLIIRSNYVASLSGCSQYIPLMFPFCKNINTRYVA